MAGDWRLRSILRSTMRPLSHQADDLIPMLSMERDESIERLLGQSSTQPATQTTKHVKYNHPNSSFAWEVTRIDMRPPVPQTHAVIKKSAATAHKLSVSAVDVLSTNSTNTFHVIRTKSYTLAVKLDMFTFHFAFNVRYSVAGRKPGIDTDTHVYQYLLIICKNFKVRRAL